MNKADLINSIAVEADFSKADAKKALEAVVKSLSDVLISGDKISLIGFGTFSVTERPARPGINPATKQPIQIAAKKVAKFKAGAELAAAIN
jgi:DNA-binding protein HU-beta